MRKLFLSIIVLLAINFNSEAKNYYFNPLKGNDKNQGTSIKAPFKSLTVLEKLKIKAGDSILLAGGTIFNEPLVLKNINGSVNKPIIVDSYFFGSSLKTASVDGQGYRSALIVENCSYVKVNNLMLTANGNKTSKNNDDLDMRCGALITTSEAGNYAGIEFNKLIVDKVFFENEGFVRGKEEVNTANGTQKYGWGIRVLNNTKDAILKDILIKNCEISNVSHTGLKITSGPNDIQNLKIFDNKITDVGGPGVQMSRVSGGLIKGNYVNGSGSPKDTRNWARGSGLWTWTCNDIIIEKNSFLNAKGPGDSAGCHIDYNCKNVIVQYNLSANNAGGFCEILGNNYNCSYRYNISVNDGYRVKGKDGAFQEGKVFWFSGYVGKGKALGPYNSYIYNNTIYTKEDMTAQIAVAITSKGVLVANNIFNIVGTSKLVAGDQYKPEKLVNGKIEDCIFENNLFLKQTNWPKTVVIQDTKPIFGDAMFVNPGGTKLEDYIPKNIQLVKNKGIQIPQIPNDELGLKTGLKVEYDILGNKIIGNPDLGAIEVK
jgi:hypothetical protein